MSLSGALDSWGWRGWGRVWDAGSSSTGSVTAPLQLQARRTAAGPAQRGLGEFAGSPGGTQGSGGEAAGVPSMKSWSPE